MEEQILKQVRENSDKLDTLLGRLPEGEIFSSSIGTIEDIGEEMPFASWIEEFLDTHWEGYQPGPRVRVWIRNLPTRMLYDRDDVEETPREKELLAHNKLLAEMDPFTGSIIGATHGGYTFVRECFTPEGDLLKGIMVRSSVGFSQPLSREQAERYAKRWVTTRIGQIRAIDDQRRHLDEGRKPIVDGQGGH